MRLLTVIGTRPEIIRLSRIIPELDKHYDHVVAHTGQNYSHELHDIFYEDLDLRKPDIFMKAARETASATIASVIEETDKIIRKTKPDAFFVLGDTNSALSVIAAKKNRVPVFHMEAGNRCFDMRVPEECNRILVDHASDVNLTYSERARTYLLAEGLRPERVICTGSPLLEVIEYNAERISQSAALKRFGVEPGKYLVASMHREENVDDPERLQALINALRALAEDSGKPIIISVHPRTRKRLDKFGLGHLDETALVFSEPLKFSDYMALQRNSFCVVSDSGTITEEAAILGFPAVTIRDTHERPEGTDFGVLVMTGISSQEVLHGVHMVTVDNANTSKNRQYPGEYMRSGVARTVARTIASYTHYVNRVVWNKAT